MAYESYIEGWRQRVRQEREQRAERERRAREIVPRLVAHLVDKYAVERVLLVGSLAEGHFELHSDIDLAVRGLHGADLFRAGGELDDLARPFTVDIIPLEDAYPEVARRFEAIGQVLHG